MESCGVSSEHYFKKVNLPTQDCDPESLLPVKPFFHLVNIVSVNENIPDFGSRIAQLTPWHKVSSLGHLIKNSDNLKSLLEIFCEVSAGQSSAAIFEFKNQGSSAHFTYTNNLNFMGDIQMELYRITCMIQLVQLAAGDKWRPKKINLVMPENNIVNLSPLLDNSKINFSQSSSGFEIENNLLELPAHIDIPKNKNSTLLKQANSSTQFIDSIQQILYTYTQTNTIHIEEIANIANMSVRSFQRRLKENGVNFNDLLSQTKYIHAKEKLGNKTLNISEIATHLGYSEVSHFTRAFHKWSGVSPSEFRKQS
jgi:AraC-like DNA-binding protein